jgi:hypothetical protein
VKLARKIGDVVADKDDDLAAQRDDIEKILEMGRRRAEYLVNPAGKPLDTKEDKDAWEAEEERLELLLWDVDKKVELRRKDAEEAEKQQQKIAPVVANHPSNSRLQEAGNKKQLMQDSKKAVEEGVESKASYCPLSEALTEWADQQWEQQMVKLQREHLLDLGVLYQIERARKLAKMVWSAPLEEQEQMARNFQQVGMAIYLKKPKQEHPSKPKEDSSDFKESCKDTTAVKEAGSCYVCGQSHAVRQCAEFLAAGVMERIKLAKKLGLCFSCLAGRHLQKKCRKQVECGQEGCKLNHHQLLHRSWQSTCSSNEEESLSRGCGSWTRECAEQQYNAVHDKGVPSEQNLTAPEQVAIGVPSQAGQKVREFPADGAKGLEEQHMVQKWVQQERQVLEEHTEVQKRMQEESEALEAEVGHKVQAEHKVEEVQAEYKVEEVQAEHRVEEAQVEEMALVAQVELGTLGAQAVKSFPAAKWCHKELKAEEVQLQAEDLVQREFLKHQRHVPGFGARQSRVDISQAWDVFDTKGTGEDSTGSSHGGVLGWRVQSCLGTSKKKLNIAQLWGGSLEKGRKVLREGGLLCKQVRLRQLVVFSTLYNGGSKKRSSLLLSASQMRMLLPWDPGRNLQISQDPNGHGKQAGMASKQEVARFLWDPGGSTEVAFRAVSSANGHVRSTKPDG